MFVRPRPLPFAFSLLTHGLILGWVASGPVYEKEPSIYRQLIAPHASKLIWYDFREKLPDVSPTKPRTAMPPRADFKIANQEIVTGSPTSPRAGQFIWQPAPKVELQQDLKSPNVLAVHTPRAEPPPKPKLFTPPPEIPQPRPPTPALAPAPQLQIAAALEPAPLKPHLPAPPLRKFVLPEPEKPRPDAPHLESAPQIAMAVPENLNTAPSVLSKAPARAATRAFVLPPASPSKPSAFGPSLAEMPDLPELSTASGVNVAIVGLHPTTTPPPQPPGSRDAQFSAGPKPRATGSDGSGVDGAMLVVPGLMVRGASNDAKPTLVARAAAPTSLQNLRAAVHNGVPGSLAAATLSRPAATRVTSAPDPSFEGRAIYAMTVQMPNVTSFSGSWIIWFAEREHEVGPSAGVSPPVPVRKVDPKYIASAIEDRVEGKVRLAAVIRKDGHVESVRLLAHLDERLDQSAQDAMNKWEFEPAVRNGQPVEVDAVIEIPFHLAPRVPR